MSPPPGWKTSRSSDMVRLVEVRAASIPDLVPRASGVRRSAIIDSLVHDDHEARAAFQPESVRRVLAAPTDREGVDLGLFFSAPRNRTLMVAVLAQYARDKPFRDLTRLNTGIIFLFCFDDAGNITKVFQRVMHFER